MILPWLSTLVPPLNSHSVCWTGPLYQPLYQSKFVGQVKFRGGTKVDNHGKWQNMSILPKIVKKSKKSSFSKSDNSAGIGRKYDFWPEIHRMRLVKHSWTIIHTCNIFFHHFDFESKKNFFESKNVDFQKTSFFDNPFFVNSWCHILIHLWVYT